MIVIFTNNNPIFPPNTCIDPVKFEWQRFCGLSPPWPKCLCKIFATDLFKRNYYHENDFIGTSFASCYRFWLCFTFCAQSISLDRQNAFDSLILILVLKHIWQKKPSQSLINEHFNPWNKYYIILNLLFKDEPLNCQHVCGPTGLMIGKTIKCVCMQDKTIYTTFWHSNGDCQTSLDALLHMC